MSAPELQDVDVDPGMDDAPEDLPVNMWMTLGIFAAFVVGLGSCMVLWMFN